MHSHSDTEKPVWPYGKIICSISAIYNNEIAQKHKSLANNEQSSENLQNNFKIWQTCEILQNLATLWDTLITV